MKSINKILPVENVYADYAVNYRDRDNYDLPTIVQQLIDGGQVNNPLIVEPPNTSTNRDTVRHLILQGNRRYWGVMHILNSPDYTEEQKKPFRKLPCIIREDMTPEQRELLIADHGTTKPLSREETVKAIWRHMMMGRNMEQIASQFYSQLANYTGNLKMLNTLPEDPTARRKKLATWFAGTLRAQIMRAFELGDYVKEQFRLSRRKEDGKLKEGVDKVEMFCSTKRMQDLSTAKTDDGDAWTYDGGGPKFNALIEKYKAEDLGKPKEEPKRMTAKDVGLLAGAYKSPLIRNTFKASLGDDEAKQVLPELEKRWTDINDRTELLRREYPRIKDENVRILVQELLSDGPLGGFVVALTPFLADDPVTAPLTTSVPPPIVNEYVETSPTENTPTDGGELAIEADQSQPIEAPAVEAEAEAPIEAEAPTVEAEAEAETPTEVIAEVVPELEAELEEEKPHKSKPRAHASSGRRGKGKRK